MRKALWILIPSFFFITLLSTLWHFSEKKIALFLRDKIQEQVKSRTKWDLKIDQIKLSLAPPKADITSVALTPPSNTKWMNTLKINSLTGSLDLLNLLAGQIKFSILQINGINTELIISEIPPSPKPIEVLPISEIFDALQVIQVKMLLLDDVDLNIKINKKTPPIKITGGMLFQTTPQTIHYSVKAKAEGKLHKIVQDTTQTKSQKTSEEINLINFNSKGSLTAKSFRINVFEVNSSQSKLGLQGEFINFAKVISHPQFSGLVDLNLDFNNLMNWLQIVGAKTEELSAKGTLRSNGKIEIEKWNIPTLDLNTEVKNASLNQYQLGSAQAQVRIQQSQVSTDILSIMHPAGELLLRDIKWNLQKDHLESAVDLKSLDLQKLFIELGLKTIPVELLVNASLQCAGPIVNNFKITCNGGVKGSHLVVKTAMNSKTAPIIALDTFSGEGTVAVDLNEVKYDTSVILPLSRGRSQGVVNFHTGFIIDFNSNNFDFKDAPQIAGLNFEGKSSQLQGRTQGDSNAATLAINLGVDSFWFENFGLGSIKGKVTYNKGHLFIDSPEGKINNTRYSAQIDVDLNRSRLKGLVDSPSLEAKDVVTALKRRVPIPFEIASGTGKTRAHFEGPFALGGLSYNFEGTLLKGDIHGETYDEINWNWVSQHGQVAIQNNTIKKGAALATVNGTATPTGHLNLNVEGKDFKLEQSTFLSKFVQTLSGDLNFRMSVQNYILKPDIKFEGQITHTTLGDTDLPDSKVDFNTDDTGLALSMELLGKQLQMSLNLPYDNQEQAHLEFEIQKFNFTDFLGSILGSPLRSEYNSLLSAKMELLSRNNNLFQGTGSLNIERLYLARNEHSIQNEKPMVIEFNNGVATLKDFQLKGPKAEIQLEGENFSPSQLKVKLDATLDANLFQLFTPFIDNMSGPVTGQIRIAGSLGSPEIYGNVDINDLALRVKGFPVLFDHITSHLEFSQKRIIIDSLRGSMGGGSIMGSGSIAINGVRDVPIDLKAQLRNIQLEVPEGVQSSGSADITLNGNWFPYLLSGTYRVSQAFIDKDFDAGAGDGNLKQSIYLPKDIAKSSFDPVVLDLQVLLDKKIEIKNPQMAGFLAGQLQIKGTPHSPVLLGTIKTLPQAQLFSRDKVFDIQSGLIKFDDPNEINPELFITARTIVETYEINLLLQGKAKSLQFTLTSQPPLEEQDIISLLALGVTNQKLDSQIQSNQQATQMGGQLGAAIISANPLNKEIKQSLGVDVKFSSNYDDTKNETVNKVTASKEIIAKKLKATASLSENQRDVRFQYLINDRLSSVLTYETSESQSGTSATSSAEPTTSIFGLDLEYKVEFK